ncbi:hypothetical protein PanWU01x14_257500, partial [Parasponia andersonii]
LENSVLGVEEKPPRSTPSTKKPPNLIKGHHKILKIITKSLEHSHCSLLFYSDQLFSRFIETHFSKKLKTVKDSDFEDPPRILRLKKKKVEKEGAKTSPAPVMATKTAKKVNEKTKEKVKNLEPKQKLISDLIFCLFEKKVESQSYNPKQQKMAT